jgi:hypothetical protein
MNYFDPGRVPPSREVVIDSLIHQLTGSPIKIAPRSEQIFGKLVCGAAT